MPHTHNHQHCITQAFVQASAICNEKGVRFTPLRKRVLELLWHSHKPAKAYDILEILQQEDKSAKPSTVYRALEFLQEMGLAHKIDSLNAYIGCARPQDGLHCQFMICAHCGIMEESSDVDIFTAIAENAARHHFKVERQVIEIHGLCQECQQIRLANTEVI